VVLSRADAPAVLVEVTTAVRLSKGEDPIADRATMGTGHPGAEIAVATAAAASSFLNEYARHRRGYLDSTRSRGLGHRKVFRHGEPEHHRAHTALHSPSSLAKLG